MRKLRLYIASLLILVFGLYSVPRQLVHGLCAHEDTIDSPLTHDTPFQVDNEHQHCVTLKAESQPQLFLPVFYSVSFAFFKLSKVFFGQHVYCFSLSFNLPQRGPPCVS